MGFSSMFRAMARVAAFTAITCLALQAACTPGIQPLTSTQSEQHGGGCHESVPPTPHAPSPSHVCCSGNHFPDALLSAAVTPAPLALNGNFLDLTAASRSFPTFSTDFPASFSPPHKPLVLRI
ncbi:MAG: hypothetical protein LAO76_07785 [Acidobacteriia bacterium]|nr:hypothetical protein [Terriglobia bacterium]